MQPKWIPYLLAIGLWSGSAQAFQSHFDTADLLNPDQYQLGIEPQLILNKSSGVNAVAHFDMGATEVSNFRFVLGTGVVPMQAGGFYKWVPVPDYENQPGIGGYFGFLYSYKNTNVSSLGFRVHPEVSKLLKLNEIGALTPYVALPLGISMESGSTTYPVQLAFGAKWLPSGLQHMHIWLEFGLELNDSFSYVSTGLTIPFDTWDNIKFN